MAVGLFVDNNGTEQFVTQAFRDDLGADHTAGVQLLNDVPVLQTCFYPVFPTALIAGSGREYKSYFPSNFISGEYPRTFKS